MTLPSNVKVPDQGNRATNWWEEKCAVTATGGCWWESYSIDNPSAFYATPTVEGYYGFTAERTKDGHSILISESTLAQASDSETKTVTNNLDVGVGGAKRTVTGSGSYGSFGTGGSYEAAVGIRAVLTKNPQTRVSQAGNHHECVKGDHGFYVKSGGLSIGADQQVAITTNETFHVEAKSEVSVKSQQNMGFTSKAQGTFYSDEDMLIESPVKITLLCGGSSIVMTPGKIVVTSAEVQFVQGSA
jgi:hypothetical protein